MKFWFQLATAHLEVGVNGVARSNGELFCQSEVEMDPEHDAHGGQGDGDPVEVVPRRLEVGADASRLSEGNPELAELDDESVDGGEHEEHLAHRAEVVQSVALVVVAAAC